MTGALDHVQLHRVSSLAALDECRRWLGENRRDFLGFDTESAGLSPEQDRCRMVQIGDREHGWAFPPAWAGAACELLGSYTGNLVAHNSAYDWRVLHCQMGLDLDWARIHDTQLAGHISDNLQPGGLKPRAAREIDPRAMAGEQQLSDGMARNRWNWATVPDDWAPYWAYSALDPVLTVHLMEKFGPAVRQYQAAYDLERSYARVCSNMMTAGMQVDVPFIENAITRIRSYCDEAKGWLRSEHGITSVESNEQVGRALNAAGVPTLAFTASGMPSISKDTLKLYSNSYPHARDLIQAIAWCRKGDAITGRYLGKFLELRDASDVIHYSIHSCIARTSRSSVTSPPMQTYDRDEPVIRGSYVPRHLHRLVTVDASQIEARFAAHFSRDRQMIGDFREADRTGASFFVIMASKIFGEQISKKDPRYTRTKNATYGQIYGAGLEKAAVTAGVTLDQMRPVYTGTQQLYPGLGALMNRLIREGRSNGRPSVRTITGRRLFAYPGKEYALLNTMIQGSAAEFMKQGVVNLDAAGFGPYLRLPVHDEVISELPEQHAEESLRMITEILTDKSNFAVDIPWSGAVLDGRWEKV